MVTTLSRGDLLLAHMIENQEQAGERIAKIMARAGLCSRREAEKWVVSGRVSVNGKKLDSPAFNVKPDDTIAVDGEPLTQRERTRLFFFHKPRGTVTTARDPQGRPTVFDILPPGLPRVVSIGRLDINTEGLLLLTNDGGLARALELPSTGWLRRYRVRAHGRTDQAVLDGLHAGITLDGVNYRGIEARLDREQGANVWLTIGLREGKNREVKRVLEHIGLDVNRLIRTSFGPFQLGELAEGEVEEVKTRVLKDQLGEKIAGLANADFEAPLFEITAHGRQIVREDFGSGRGRPRDGEPPDGSRDDRHPGKSDGKGGTWVRAGKPESKPARKSAEPPPESPKPGKRRHISTLREDRDARSKVPGERRRIEKSATADRRGREVPVERILAPARRTRPEDSEAKPSRNAERFIKLARQKERATSGDEPVRRPRRAYQAHGVGTADRSAREPPREHKFSSGKRSDGFTSSGDRPRSAPGKFRSREGAARPARDGERSENRSRQVPVERIVAPARRTRPDDSEAKPSRNAERFTKPARQKERATSGDEPVRRPRRAYQAHGVGTADRSAREPPREHKFSSGKRSDGFTSSGDRPRSAPGKFRSREGAARPARDGERSENRSRQDTFRGEARKFDKPWKARLADATTLEKPRREGAIPRHADAARTSRPVTGRSAKPGAGRKGGAGRPQGRPGGGRPGGGRPGGGRPGGGRTGGKPGGSGSRPPRKGGRS